MSSRFLIVTADDFGLHPAVNEAVERAARHGCLSAASLMVAAPAAADAVRRARELPALRVGLHLVLCDGAAVLPPVLIPDLVDAAGRFGARMVRDGLRFFALRSVRRQLEAEIHSQFAAFARTGLELDHVNAHKHFHLHPTVLGMMLRIGRDFGLRAVRVPDEPLWFGLTAGARLRAGTHALLLAPWLRLMKQRLGAAGVMHCDRVFGIARSGCMDEGSVLEVLARLPPGSTELYLHPATQGGARISASMHAYRHDAELHALLSPRVRAALAALAASGTACGGYADLARILEARAAGV